MTNTSRNLVHCYLACDPDRRLPRTIGYLGLRTDDHAIGILARMRAVEECLAIEVGEIPGRIPCNSYPATAADFEIERLKREARQLEAEYQRLCQQLEELTHDQNKDW